MSDTIAVTITVDAGRSTGTYKPIWNWFGYDEPNYTYTRNGKKLLGELAALSPEPIRMRCHNLLTSGDGVAALKWGSTNAYTEDAIGRPVYDWTIIDRIFDAYVEAGIIPFVQVGFTPEALSGHAGPYRHFFVPSDKPTTIIAGWAAPPKDLKKWADFIEAWARHLADRYGMARVAGWPWEVWNEPDGNYWLGSIPEFCAMYDVTVAAIKRTIPGVRVGGPHTCGVAGNAKAEKFLREFLKHCAGGTNAATGGTGSPIDFIAFHAKGDPVLHDGHVRMGIARHLQHISGNLAIMREFPSLAGLTAILGESDPEGCAACSARYTPRNGYRNGPLYGVYVIESMVRTYELSRSAGIEIEGAVTWAFLFEGQPYFEGFRDLATNGIDKAVLNAFRMLGMLGGEWVAAVSSHALPIQRILTAGVREQPDVNAVATRDAKGVSVLAWHYHDDDVPGAAATVALTIGGWPTEGATLRHYRMDHEHSNAHAVWQEMGSLQVIEGADYTRLEGAGKLKQLEERALIKVEGGAVKLATTLPRQGVSLFRLEW
jgi:xylan 1,4-beta-xylosidase